MQSGHLISPVAGLRASVTVAMVLFLGFGLSAEISVEGEIGMSTNKK
jgi:hypothetical protein